MTAQERLLERLRAEGLDLPPCTELRRTHRNRQSGVGTWSWFAYCPLTLDDPEHYGHMRLSRYGSHWPMSWLLKAKSLRFDELSTGDTCIDPAE